MQDKVNSKLYRWENDLRLIQHNYRTKVKPIIESSIGKPLTHATIEVLQQSIDLFLYDIDIKVNVIKVNDNDLVIIGNTLTDQLVWEIITESFK